MPIGDYNELDELRGDIQQPNGAEVGPPFVRYEAGTFVLIRPTAQQLIDANPEFGESGGGGSLTAMTLTVAELTALNSPSVDTLHFVYDATYGLGIYIFSTAGTATSAPTYYRADDNSGVWTKVL